MTKLVLYFAPGSSSMAVHIALQETGAPYEPKPMTFANKDTRKPDYLALNPAGKVPLLLIDGRPLNEVAGCLYYLARSYPDARLLPDDVEAQAQVVSWMSFLASTIHPARRQGLEHANEVWQVADKRLGANPWAVGGRYSIADIHLFRLFWRMSASLKPPPGTLGNLFTHYERMMARAAVKKTIEIEAAIGYDLPA